MTPNAGEPRTTLGWRKEEAERSTQPPMMARRGQGGRRGPATTAKPRSKRYSVWGGEEPWQQRDTRPSRALHPGERGVSKWQRVSARSKRSDDSEGGQWSGSHGAPVQIPGTPRQGDNDSDEGKDSDPNQDLPPNWYPPRSHTQGARTHAKIAHRHTGEPTTQILAEPRFRERQRLRPEPGLLPTQPRSRFWSQTGARIKGVSPNEHNSAPIQVQIPGKGADSAPIQVPRRPDSA